MPLLITRDTHFFLWVTPPPKIMLELKSEQVDIGSEYSIESKQGTLSTLPSFLGDEDDKIREQETTLS